MALIRTIGHSNHGIERFLALLRAAGTGTVVDVRSMPASRRHPQFNRAALAAALAEAGIGYEFAGDALGGRPRAGAVADYERIAATPEFAAGLARVEAAAARAPVALMCAEREPLDCHRVLLVARRLAERGHDLVHLMADGSAEPHARTEERLLATSGGGDLLSAAEPRTARLAAAYRARNAALAGKPAAAPRTKAAVSRAGGTTPSGRRRPA